MWAVLMRHKLSAASKRAAAASVVVGHTTHAIRIDSFYSSYFMFLCSFPDVFPRREFSSSDESLLSKYYYNGRMSNMDMMAAVNTSSLVGRHLELHAQQWKRTARGMKAQLASLHCDVEESEEMEERLLSLSERYDSNA